MHQTFKTLIFDFRFLNFERVQFLMTVAPIHYHNSTPSDCLCHGKILGLRLRAGVFLPSARVAAIRCSPAGRDTTKSFHALSLLVRVAV